MKTRGTNLLVWLATMSILGSTATVLHGQVATARFQVIAHRDNPLSSLSTRDLSRLFLKRTLDWPNGTDVEPIDQKIGSEVREAFSQTIHGRSTAKIESYWQRKIFAGEMPPPQIGSDAEVIALVCTTPGAIGYISGDAASRDDISLEGVKILGVMKPPEVLERTSPRYPPDARQEGRQGTVRLWVTVAADGRPLTIEIRESLGEALDRAAENAVRGWRFEAAQLDGAAVEGDLEVTVDFFLDTNR